MVTQESPGTGYIARSLRVVKVLFVLTRPKLKINQVDQTRGCKRGRNVLGYSALRRSSYELRRQAAGGAMAHPLVHTCSLAACTAKRGCRSAKTNQIPA